MNVEEGRDERGPRMEKVLGVCGVYGNGILFAYESIAIRSISCYTSADTSCPKCHCTAKRLLQAPCLDQRQNILCVAVSKLARIVIEIHQAALSKTRLTH